MISTSEKKKQKRNEKPKAKVYGPVQKAKKHFHRYNLCYMNPQFCEYSEGKLAKHA